MRDNGSDLVGAVFASDQNKEPLCRVSLHANSSACSLVDSLS